MIAYCHLCGELIALHRTPCRPGVCVSKDCTEPQAVNDLGLCAAHHQLVVGQRGRTR